MQILRFLRLGVLLAAGPISTACDPANEVHVEPGSTADALVLHAYRSPDSLSGLGTVTRLAVGRCGGDWLGEPVWAVERESRHWLGRPEPTRIEYGRTPSNRWRTVTLSAPLDSGCFYAAADGNAIGGLTFFRVLPGGAIESMPDSVYYAERTQIR